MSMISAISDLCYVKDAPTYEEIKRIGDETLLVIRQTRWVVKFHVWRLRT